METFLWLAEAEGGFGLNFDIFSTNLINLAIVIGVLYYFGRGFLGKILNERRSDIETAIGEAEQQASKAQQELTEAKKRLEQAQAQAQQIRADAEERAKATKEEILAEAQADIERLKATAAQDLKSDESRAAAQLRERAIALALERSQQYLKERLSDDDREQIVDRSISLIGGKE
ncbi:F0F1 ATP synthase subunit B [Baaleninema sp.]|uniref:F0F1 ATP synthase subunit B n=1 Tax=Baaleninema sp. TaxID=3101197 RepID=UPI003CFF770B